MRRLGIFVQTVLISALLISGCGIRNKENTAAPESRQSVPETAAPSPTAEPLKGYEVQDEKYSAYSAEGYAWGLKKNEGAKPDVGKYDTIISPYNACYMDKKEGNTIYLTFDEGYENGYTDDILDVLAEKNVKAVFFITGPYLKTETELVRRMVEEGHDVGNHTVNHPNISKLTPSELAREVGELNDEFYAIFGQNMKYMRPPEGAFSERALAVLSDLGYKTVFWSFAYRDWERGKVMGADYAFSQITPYLHNGAVLLLHAVSADNAAALGSVIDYARSKGFEFGTLDMIE